MKAMILNQYSENATFQMVDIEQPAVKPGHVLVRVSASSVNTVDTMIKNMGEQLPLSPALPAVLGMDFAGTVEAVGEGVTAFVPGDEVYGCAGGLADLQGSLADFMLADENLVSKKPSTLSMREAAALPLVGITAYEGLVRANVKAGQKVLVHGGTGGVGHVAVQVAKQMGAEVYATISSDAQAEIVKSYGATPINYREESVADYVAKYTNGAGFDVVYDSVGAANMLNSFEAAALNGQVVTTVSMLELDLTLAHFKGLSIHVVFMLIPMLHNMKREEHQQILSALAEIADAGDLKPLLDENRYSLEQVGEAYGRLTSGQAIGKVVVEG
ncbi:Zinc-type alcohol dehydrogenase-like protein [Grimontia celer]|uniref:Zinc-type alcohol dehydrogenase-like protein n=1 Tax=Grimontia celer TaxID=1796497 RepID=A0A128ERZ6_9GAMM|nr:zinc-dependent alcohol dehydrogenase family protein [Grimontia celer]CZF77342.1 Zinc-type alcohol dehydrogenase-like protein [Grimontia celer]